MRKIFAAADAMEFSLPPVQTFVISTALQDAVWMRFPHFRAAEPETSGCRYRKGCLCTMRKTTMSDLFLCGSHLNLRCKACHFNLVYGHSLTLSIFFKRWQQIYQNNIEKHHSPVEMLWFGVNTSYRGQKTQENSRRYSPHIYLSPV